MKRIITVSREFGSGGHAVAQIMGELLGVPVYDKEIIERSAEESGLSPEFISRNEQNLSSEWLYSVGLGSRYASPSLLTFADTVFLAQRKAIVGFAQNGSCIIVGRCADHILTHCEEISASDVLNIFVFAPAAFKADRAVRERGFSPKTAERDIRIIDKKRANHYSTFTEQTWGARENYNLLVDSSVLGIEGTARSLVEFIRKTK